MHLVRSQRAPIFIQFLDCVWQLTRQFPLSFEYNDNFLLQIAAHLHSHLFGTFLCDCESDRKSISLSEMTASLWGLILNAPPSITAMYKNPMYVRTEATLEVNSNSNCIQLWRSYHQMWASDNIELTNSKSNINEIHATLLHEKVLFPYLERLPQVELSKVRQELLEWFNTVGSKKLDRPTKEDKPEPVSPLQKSRDEVDWDAEEDKDVEVAQRSRGFSLFARLTGKGGKDNDKGKEGGDSSSGTEKEKVEEEQAEGGKVEEKVEEEKENGKENEREDTSNGNVSNGRQEATTGNNTTEETSVAV